MAYLIIDDPSGYGHAYEVPIEVYTYVQKLREQIKRKTDLEIYVEEGGK